MPLRPRTSFRRRSYERSRFQETFLRALPAFDQLRARSNHRAWIYRIATNVFLNDRRRHRRRSEVPLADEITAPIGSPDRRHQARVAAVACRRAIITLPPKQRAAFIQRKVLGLTYPQIADAMKCTEVAARANVSQAVRRLRRLLVDME